MSDDERVAVLGAVGKRRLVLGELEVPTTKGQG